MTTKNNTLSLLADQEAVERYTKLARMATSRRMKTHYGKCAAEAATAADKRIVQANRDAYAALAAAERIVNAKRVELWREAPLTEGWQKAHNIRQYLDRQAQAEWEGR